MILMSPAPLFKGGGRGGLQALERPIMERDFATRALEELRKRLIIVTVLVFFGGVACFFYIEEIRRILVMPGEGLEMQMVFLTPQEALLANLRLSFVAGALITLPVLLYQLVALVTFLARRGRKGAFLLAFAMYILFALGLSFAYFVVFPFALNFFLSFASADLMPRFSISQYLSFATSFLFAFGLVFQLPLVFWFLGVIGVVNTAFLRRNRKFALLVIVVFSAVLTPPDVFSQVLMSIPLLVLYEFGIMLVSLTQRKKARQMSSNL